MVFKYCFRVFISIITLLFFLSTPQSVQALPAFPGCEGFGCAATGGRGGQILFVTNLNDSGVGSLRAALTASGSRIVIPKVNGTVTLVSPIVIKNPNLTYAGQTARLMIRQDGIEIQTFNVIIRGMVVRVGDQGSLSDTRDGIKLYDTQTDVYDVVVDHSSFAWAIDENGSTTANYNGHQVHDVTVSYNIFAEGLDYSIHSSPAGSERHSMGFLMNLGGNRLSFHHNLLATNWARNPFLAGATNVDFINNVIYGWWDYSLMVRDTNTGNIVNNYFKTASYSKPYEIMLIGNHSLSKLYKSGNTTNYNGSDMPIRISGSLSWLASPLFSGISADPASVAYADVLDNAGAIRDPVDDRIITNVRNRTGNIINSQSEVGGWPTSFYAGKTPADSDNDGLPDNWESHNPNDVANSGYTWIEEYVNSFFSDETSPTVSPSPTPKPWTTLEGDYSIWFTNYLKLLKGFSNGDFSDDGLVDGIDYVLWLINYAN